MGTFSEAIKVNALDDVVYLKFGVRYSEEHATLHRLISQLESIDPEIIAITHLCEYSLKTENIKPNTNHQTASIWNWDIGPFQLNLGWTVRCAWQGQIKTMGLEWSEVFGSSFYESDNVTPCSFNGQLLANGRAAARRLLSFHGTSEAQAVHYTGPGLPQEHRLLAWQN